VPCATLGDAKGMTGAAGLVTCGALSVDEAMSLFIAATRSSFAAVMYFSDDVTEL
jgi:hypothetical protein